MGDRNNPIKFGPEWLRNLSRERSAGAAAGNSHNPASPSGAATAGAGAGASGHTAPAAPPSATNTNTPPKVQLAKLRYGREEMLALYDRTSEAPQELKHIDILYQSRGKPPVALNNTFEEDMRDTMRPTPPLGGMAGGERFGVGRGMGRGMNLTEGVRGRPRLPFVRQLSAGRGSTSWHSGPRTPGVYSGGPDEDPSPVMRSWNSSNGGVAAARSTGDQAEWTPNKLYRSKRIGPNTNWRSPRDDEEWRDNSRSRPPQEKWERDWGDNRPAHRRTWVGGDTQNSDDNLPEWAVDNAEACGGTFDSSGAFHGYSNDDSNLPKSPESAYTLTRSHTHGSLVRTKPAEEGSEEWWASEKAKKLSPKRFDASDIKFKKPNAVIPELNSGPPGSSSKSNNTQEEAGASSAGPSTSAGASKEQEPPATAIDLPETNAGNNDDSFNKKSVRFAESKTFDALMRSDINLNESDDRGNFQSVMIASNNSLRQKHQNIVQTTGTNRQNRKPGILQMLHTQKSQKSDSDMSNQHTNPEEKMVEDLMDMTLDDPPAQLATTSDSMMPSSSANDMSAAMSNAVNSVSQMTSPGMQLRMSSPIHHVQGLTMNPNSSMANSGMQNAGLQSQGMMGPVGITNSALNASLGLPLGPPNSQMGQAMGLPMQGVPPPVLPSNQGMGNSAVGSAGLQPGQLPSFQPSGGLPGISGANVINTSLFLGQNANNPSLQPTGEMQMNHSNQNMFPMHGLQHSGSQAPYNSSIYSNIMQQSQAPNPPSSQALTEQWYYEDPKKNIQGPFSSKEMYSWYRAGFFNSSLMVRRACDAVMRPLGSYGPVVPFAQMDHMMSPFPMGSSFEPRGQGPHDSLLNPQPGLGLDVMSMSETSSMDKMQFGSVGLIRNPPFGQQQMVDSLWSQPSPSPDLLWMQQAMGSHNETRVNNLPMFFWDQQPSTMGGNSLIPEGLPKEMKTEDEILAQLRASQNVGGPQKLPFGNEQPPLPPGPPPVKPDEPLTPYPTTVNMTPNLEELQKLIQEDSLKDIPLPPEPPKESFNELTQVNVAKENEHAAAEAMKLQAAQQAKQPQPPADAKTSKQAKNEAEKTTKNKENTKTKNNKKAKEDKKEEAQEVKAQDEDATKLEKRSDEPSPTKSKKEEKNNKKELEKEKNQWIKEGFTIVKTEKNAKEGKKKTEEVKAVEDAERKRKEEERLAAEEERKKRQAELLRRQQELQQQQQQRQAAESVAKKAPWSAVSTQTLQQPNKEGLTLAEIQRLEREKKLEQMKEQQQMMQIIAQQQAAALAREQEMQAGLGWAKKKANSMTASGKSLSEIQAEARKNAAAAAAAAASQTSFEEAMPSAAPSINHVPWGNPYNGGFWDTPTTPAPKVVQEPPKPVEAAKPKKKPTLAVPVKKEITPAAEFESWCTSILTSWSAKIDVPTFVGFLRDIESPYEVKDYVKCYLGDTKDSNDFARQFLERRSKLLRVGMVTPSDDLCSPALAVNPRTTSGSDYQEVKSKGKKTKKNKMMKVDAARLLGFSVTAAEDRINVGDIDTV